MDLPVWQALYTELAPKGFVVIAVAFDSGGAEAAGQWIQRANPTYPCLIDRRHVVAELYNMVNVPIAVWINEEGRIVRPPEPAGTTDGFRQMDRTTFAMPPEALADLRETRRRYLDALRDWAERGDQSPFALPEEEVLRRLQPYTDEQALAAAHFRLGEYLSEQGHPGDAQVHFAEAKRLRPESWSYRRQSWALEDPSKAGGPEFWTAVESLGDQRYYEEIQLNPSQP
jgi:hypothetical protein